MLPFSAANGKKYDSLKISMTLNAKNNNNKIKKTKVEIKMKNHEPFINEDHSCLS